VQRLPCIEGYSADHQKMASKKAALGGSLTTGRHKDICGVLSRWREVVKEGVAPGSCTEDLVAFLQRENARCPKDAEGAPEAALSERKSSVSPCRTRPRTCFGIK